MPEKEKPLEDTSPGTRSPELRLLNSEPHEVQLKITLGPHSRGCAYEFCHYLFRGDIVLWNGPARVNWMGHLLTSSFVPIEEKSTAGGTREPHRIWVLGDPICLVVDNPTNEQIDVVITVKGKAAV